MATTTFWLTVLGGLALAFASYAVPGPEADTRDEAPERPNVIVILTDDQGTLDTRRYGSDDLETPHLDALADEGVRFTQFYAASAVCSPSRASLLTGRYPVRAGLAQNSAPPPLEGADFEQGLPASETTIAEVLRDAGYATGHVGKWHLGQAPGMTPNEQGFDHSFGHLGGCIDNYGHVFYWDGPNRHDLWRNGEEVHHDGEYFPDLVVTEAERFMEANRDRPFFLYVALNLPHYPLQGDARWREHYVDLPYPRNLYAPLVSTVDDRVGQIVAAVERLGLREETLIVFQSDHGHSVEVRAHGGGGNAGPYRGAKFSLFEGGIRVPAIASMPGTLPRGEVRDQVAHGADWFATILDLAGAAPPDVTLDGRSLLGVLRDDAPSPHERLHWQIGDGAEAQWAVREGDWKLIGNAYDPTASGALPDLILTNVALDPSEQTDYLTTRPEIAQRLRSAHEALVREIEP